MAMCRGYRREHDRPGQCIPAVSRGSEKEERREAGENISTGKEERKLP